MLVSLHILLVILLLNPGYSLKMFAFENPIDQNIAHIILKTPSTIPQNFTFCSSFKENYVDGRSFFTIYDESHKPWMALSNWLPGNTIIMWLQINTVWIKIREVPFYWTNFWIHVCIYVDTLSDNVSISLNGEQPLSYIVPGLSLVETKDLQGRLYIGLSEHDKKPQRQFEGQVANMNLLSAMDSRGIQNMSANLCGVVGDIVNPDVQWENVGLVKEKVGKESDICNRNQTYTVAFSARVNWNEAVQICDKLGGGNLTEAMNKRNLDEIISLFETMNSSCKHVWTPLVDEELEGEFKSSVTSQLVSYLPWKEGQPDGGDTCNHVNINMDTKLYHDTSRTFLNCFVCDLYKATVFFLLGVCETSYFGKFNVLSVFQWFMNLVQILSMF